MEIILPAFTWSSDVVSVINAGFKPILVDTEFLKPTIDLIELKNKITNKTKVILPVHLYGSVANLTGIKKIIRKKKNLILELKPE